MPSIQELIEANRAAVIADEANFDADGHCIDAAAAEQTLAACNDTLQALIEAQCQSSGEAKAKIEYFTTARIRDRYSVADEVVDLLFNSQYAADGLGKLLRSLVLPV